MAVRRRYHGNGGAIASRASHTRLRCSRVIVAYLCFIRSGGLVGIWSVAVSRPMSMPTMPKQVHCDHADEKYEPDPVVADPVHHSLRRYVMAHNVERRSKRIVPTSCIDIGQTPDSASDDTFSAMLEFSAAPCAAR